VEASEQLKGAEGGVISQWTRVGVGRRWFERCRGGGAQYGLKGLVCEACLVNLPCCYVPCIGVYISWSSVWHGGNLVLDA